MSDFGADPFPDIDKIQTVAFGYRLAPLAKLKIDQFSTATPNKVYSLVQRIGSTRLQFLVDPAAVPG